MPAYAYAIIVAGWLFWLTPFLRARQSEKPAKQLDRRARWGILLVAVAFWLLWQGHFWERSPQPWRTSLSLARFLLPGLLFWTGTPALRLPWRNQRGLSAEPARLTPDADRLSGY